MKEVHIGPMSLEGSFHTGKIIEVVSADVYARWQLLNSSNISIAVVHDSWNTYGPERNRFEFEQKEDRIASYKHAKESLRVLPSADLQLENGSLTISSGQEFRDDASENVAIVNTALRSLKRSGLVVPGVIKGERGLYFDLDKAIEKDFIPGLLDRAQIFPVGYNTIFKRSIDKNNDSCYLGRIPITKERTFGLPVDTELLESDYYYTDPRFSQSDIKKDSSDQEQKICVAPLVILGLLPYIRAQNLSDNREVDFISNGTASSVRFNLVSLLLNKSLGKDLPYRNIHLFGKLDLEEATDADVLASKDWAMKTRYVIFDQLSANKKIVSSDYACVDQETNKLEVTEFDSFIKKLFHLQHVVGYEKQDNFSEVTREEKAYLQSLGVNDAMNNLDYSKAFKKIKNELSKRAKTVLQGVSPNDQILLRMINLFLPEL